MLLALVLHWDLGRVIWHGLLAYMNETKWKWKWDGILLRLSLYAADLLLFSKLYFT